MTINTTGDGTYVTNGVVNAGSTGAADGVTDGTVTITGGNYTGANAFEQLIVGETTDGAVTINGGSQVDVDAAINNNFPAIDQYGNPTGSFGAIYGAINVGRDLGSSGILDISGIGTQVNVFGAPGGLRIGDNGTGVVTVSNVGSLGLAEIDIGQSGDGTLNITSGSTVSVNSSFGLFENQSDIPGSFPGQFIGQGGFVRVGRNDGGEGALNITDGGLLDIRNVDGLTDGAGIQIGREDGSYGRVTVDGQGSEILIEQVGYIGDDEFLGAYATVGQAGQGVLELSNDAQLNIIGDSALIRVGRGASYTTENNVQDAESLLLVGSGSDVVIDGSAGGAYNGLFVASTGDSNVSARTTITGDGSTLTTLGDGNLVRVGNDGVGVVDVLDGGYLSTFFAEFGRNATGNGTLNIDGDGSRVVLSDVNGRFIDPAYSGEAAFARFGREAGSQGFLNITNGGSLELSNTDGLTDSPAIQLARNDGSYARAIVNGDGSNITITQTGVNGDDYAAFSSLVVGRGGQGILEVSNNGTVNINGDDTGIAVGQGGVDGVRDLQSRLEISSGGVVDLTSEGNDVGTFVNIGRNIEGNGLVSVDGVGSELNVTTNNSSIDANVSAFITVGRDGLGVLSITNGGTVNITGGPNDNFPGLNIGRNETGDGTLNIDGVGSSLNILGSNDAIGGGSGFITVGRNGSGELNVTNGGQFNNNSTDSAMFIGRETTGQGVVEVTGSGSLVDGGELVIVGADFDFSANDISAVDFVNGGQGRITAVNDGTFRGDEIFLGNGGAITGNGTIDGNVTLNGDDSTMSTAELGPGTGAVPGAALNITGNLTMTYGTLNLELFGTTAANNDLITVGGIASLDGGSIDISFRDGFIAEAGDSFTLVSGSDLNVDFANLDIDTFNEASDQAFYLADTGSDLVLGALNNGTGNAILDFGTSNNDGASVEFDNGNGGYGSGGIFDSVVFTGVTEVRTTNSDDIINLSGSDGITVDARDGDDLIIAGAGADIIDGGDDEDTVSYENSASGVVVNLDGSASTGGNAEGDMLSNVENVTGSDFDDLFGASLEANDFNGGSGVDTVSYADAASGVSVFTSGRSGLQNGSEAAGDRLNDIENITGSDQQDQIVLNAATAVDNEVNAGDGDDSIRDRDGGTNTLNGEGGEDRIFGGVGVDILDGGSDSDLLFGGDGDDILNGGIGDFRDELFGNADNDTISGGGGDDRLRGETGEDTVNGGTGNDNIRGGVANDMLFGDAGDDTILGDQGDDTIDGGTGNDRLFGGNNSDTFIFATDYDFDRILDFQLNRDDVDLTDFGVADFATLQGMLVQSGNNVTIDFGGDDILQINGVTIAELEADNFIL